MLISIETIQLCFTKIIDYYKSCNIDPLDFSEIDMYLSILPDEWQNLGEEHIEPSVGSLYEDIEGIKQALADDCFTSIDFWRMAAILYASSSILGSQKNDRPKKSYINEITFHEELIVKRIRFLQTQIDRLNAMRNKRPPEIEGNDHDVGDARRYDVGNA